MTIPQLKKIAVKNNVALNGAAICAKHSLASQRQSILDQLRAAGVKVA